MQSIAGNTDLNPIDSKETSMFSIQWCIEKKQRTDSKGQATQFSLTCSLMNKNFISLNITSVFQSCPLDYF